MFEEIDRIERVKAFVPGEHLCYLDADRGVLCSNGFEFKTDVKGTLSMGGDILVKQSFRGELQIFDVKQKSLIFQNKKEDQMLFIASGEAFDGDRSVYVTRKIGATEEFGSLNYREKNFKKIGNSPGTVIPNFRLVIAWGGSLNSINAVSLLNGTPVWSFNSFEEYTDSRDQLKPEVVQNFLGEDIDNLWFGLSSGKLIAVSAKTGNLVHALGFSNFGLLDASTEERKNTHVPFGQFVQMDGSIREIFGLRDKYFSKINLNQSNPSREYIDVSATMAAHKISSSYRNYVLPFDSNYIYFCDDRQGKIGVFDRTTLEVVWSQELKIDKDGIAQILEMKFYDNRWYILDRNETLHIFERIVK